jgi:hypothetical protein
MYLWGPLKIKIEGRYYAKYRDVILEKKRVKNAETKAALLEQSSVQASGESGC